MVQQTFAENSEVQRRDLLSTIDSTLLVGSFAFLLVALVLHFKFSQPMELATMIDSSISIDSTEKVVITLKNTWHEPIQLVDVVVSCGCMAVEVSDRIIAKKEMLTLLIMSRDRKKITSGSAVIIFESQSGVQYSKELSWEDYGKE